jgi:hypothetical protein
VSIQSEHGATLRWEGQLAALPFFVRLLPAFYNHLWEILGSSPPSRAKGWGRAPLQSRADAPASWHHDPSCSCYGHSGSLAARLVAPGSLARV